MFSSLTSKKFGLHVSHCCDSRQWNYFRSTLLTSISDLTESSSDDNSFSAKIAPPSILNCRPLGALILTSADVETKKRFPKSIRQQRRVLLTLLDATSVSFLSSDENEDIKNQQINIQQVVETVPGSNQEVDDAVDVLGCWFRDCDEDNERDKDDENISEALDNLRYMNTPLSDRSKSKAGSFINAPILVSDDDSPQTVAEGDSCSSIKKLNRILILEGLTMCQDKLLYNRLATRLLYKHEVTVYSVDSFESFTDLLVMMMKALAKQDDSCQLYKNKLKTPKPIFKFSDPHAEIWYQQLCVFPGVSATVAEVLVKNYPTPYDLKCCSIDDLADIEVSSTRRIGPALARRLHAFFANELTGSEAVSSL